MPRRDYYNLLEVGRFVTSDELKRSFRRLAVRYHPDKNPHNSFAEEKFKGISVAYDVLSDPRKRILYDRYGHDWLKSDKRDSATGTRGASPKPKGRSTPLWPERGREVRYLHKISFEEGAYGCTHKISVARLEVCAPCLGTGAKRGASIAKCSRCAGSGQVRMRQGHFNVSKPCPRCNGEGTTIRVPCEVCHGKKKVRQERWVVVIFPPGIDSETRLKVKGEGEHGKVTGDLIVEVQVSEHPLFSRSGMDITCEIPITFTQAALGGEVEVPTLTTRIKLKIPEGTQSHQTFRLREKGIHSPTMGTTGDQLVTAIVETPTHLNLKQKKILAQLASMSGENVNPIKRKFFHKVKDLFG